MSNWVASATEDFGALIGISLALFAPVLCLLLILTFLLCAAGRCPGSSRACAAVFSRMANHMVPTVAPVRARVNPPFRSKHD